MTTHQKSKACRAIGSDPRTKPAAGSSSGSVQVNPYNVETEPDTIDTGTVGDGMIVDAMGSGPMDTTADDAAAVADPAELMRRACQRLDNVGADLDVAERMWNTVGLVDDHGNRVVGVADENSGDEDENGGGLSMEDADQQADESVLAALVELMAPSDGSLGLTAAQRKRLFDFANMCLSRGGSQATITDILRSVTPSTNSGQQQSTSSERLLELYLDSLCSGDGWTEKTFSLVTGHIATTRWNSNIIVDLIGIVQDPEMFPLLRLKPEYDGQNFDHPATGLHMFAFYNLIKKQREKAGDWDDSRDVILLLVFFSDATLLVNKGSLSAHPVVLSVANLPPKLASGNQLLLGFLSEFDKTQKESGPADKRKFSTKENAELKRAMMAKQTAAIVAPLVRASYEGVWFRSPIDGRKMRFFPTLFCAPLDHPEVCAHLGVKSTYCGICKWKSQDYAKGNRSSPKFRTEEDSMNFVDMIRKAPSKNIDSLKKSQGAHGQRSGLWGFNGSAPKYAIPKGLSAATKKAVAAVGSTTPWTNLHFVVAGESMHEIDLGVLTYAREAVLFHLRETLGYGDTAIEEVNEGLRVAMTVESRWPGLRHPPSKKATAELQGYYGGVSRVEATEHRSVLQFTVPILVRFLGMNDPATRLMASVVAYYRARQVRPPDEQPGLRTHTKESLRQVGRLFKEMSSLLNKVHPPTTTEATPKMHQQTHFRLQVMRVGTTSVTTGQAGEANNAKIKSSVTGRRTNMQKGSIERTIVKLHRRSKVTSLASRSRTGRTLALPATAKKYKTSEILAAQSDFCVFSSQRNVRSNNRFTTADIHSWVHNHIGSVARPRQMARFDATTDVRRDLFNLAPADSHKDQDTVVNKRLATIFGDWTVASAFLNELSYFLTGQSANEAFSELFTLKSVQTASNPSVLAQTSRNLTKVRMLQRIHADPCFRSTKRMQYDFVALTAETPHKGESLWYARLLLLFHINIPCEKGKWRQLAFVRYLSRGEKREDELRRMKRTAEPKVTPLVYSHRRRKNKTVWYYGVCSVESILRRVHVLAGNDEGSISLRHSRGDREYFECDRKAKFLLNYNIFDSTTEPYLRPDPPSG